MSRGPAKSKQLEAIACGPIVVMLAARGSPRRHIGVLGSIEPLCGHVVGLGLLIDGHPKGERIAYRRCTRGSPKMLPLCQACIARGTACRPRAVFAREES